MEFTISFKSDFPSNKQVLFFTIWMDETFQTRMHNFFPNFWAIINMTEWSPFGSGRTFCNTSIIFSFKIFLVVWPYRPFRNQFFRRTFFSFLYLDLKANVYSKNISKGTLRSFLVIDCFRKFRLLFHQFIQLLFSIRFKINFVWTFNSIGIFVFIRNCFDCTVL